MADAIYYETDEGVRANGIRYHWLVTRYHALLLFFPHVHSRAP